MKVEQVVPILNVSDVEASVAWFGKLGWEKGFEWRVTPGGPIEFGAVTAARARSSSATTARAAAAGAEHEHRRSGRRPARRQGCVDVDLGR